MHEHVLGSMASHWTEPTDPGSQAVSRVPLSLETLWRARADPNSLLDNCILDDRELALRELARFKAAGGGAVVEVSCIGLDPDPLGLTEISRRAGIHVVCGTGFYTAAALPNATAARRTADLADQMVRDIMVGIGVSGVRAGVIGEIGVSEPMAPVERRVLQAAAQAHVTTGALLIVHPGPGPASIAAVADLLDAEGASPSKVVLGHADERLRSDTPAMLRLLKRGFNLGFDTFGRELYMPWRGRQHPSDAQRIESLAEILRHGFADQVVLSQDLAWKHELSAFGGHGYDHVLRAIVPRIRAAGVGDQQIQQLLVGNPSRLLALA
jgi:phosphotriesterase-related protein